MNASKYSNGQTPVPPTPFAYHYRILWRLIYPIALIAKFELRMSIIMIMISINENKLFDCFYSNTQS